MQASVNIKQGFLANIASDLPRKSLGSEFRAGVRNYLTPADYKSYARELPQNRVT
jgi:hypothetical protein